MVEKLLTGYCQHLSLLARNQADLIGAMGKDSNSFLKAFNNVGLSRRELNDFESQAIETILRERGLGVCSHRGHLCEPVGEGIFSKDDLSLVYYRGDLVTLRSDSHRHKSIRPWQEIELHCLCRKHLRQTFKGLNITEPSCYPNCEPNIISLVEERGDRLVTVVGNIDVTSVPLKTDYHPDLASYLDLPWAQ